MTAHVSSEIGRMRAVLVHSPGPELLAVTPSNRADYLYDDIIEAESAQREHRRFIAILERFSTVLQVRSVLAEVDPFDVAAVEKALEPLPERLDAKPGRVYQPIRVAITGTAVSPGIFESLAALGRDESLARIDAALLRLRS